MPADSSSAFLAVKAFASVPSASTRISSMFGQLWRLTDASVSARLGRLTVRQITEISTGL